MLDEYAVVRVISPALQLHTCLSDLFPSRFLNSHASRNTQIEDTCIAFRSWHIYTLHAFVFSCLAIVALGVLYEWLREAQKTMDRKIAATLSAQGKGKSRSGGPVSGRYSPEADSEEAGLLTGLSVLKAGNGYVSFLRSRHIFAF